MVFVDLAEIIRRNAIRLRLERGLSPDQAADLYGCEVSYIYQIEGGSRGIGKRAAKRLSEIYAVELKEFIKMPAEIGDPELERLWEKVYRLQKGQYAELFSKLTDLLVLVEEGKAPEETVNNLNSQITTLLKIINPA